MKEKETILDLLKTLSKWVEAGHNEIDYAVIGHAYLLGIKGVTPDF